MGEDTAVFRWENGLRGLIGDSEEEKLANLRAQVLQCRARRRKWGIVVIVAFVAPVVIVLGYLLISPGVGIDGGADLADCVVGVFLALWAFLKRWLPSLHHRDVNEAIGKVVPRETFEKILKDAHGSPDLAMCAPLLAALAIFAICLLDMVIADGR